MVSSPAGTRVRKHPEERRAEIVQAAAAIALEEGLERITLRAVAQRLGVRPGLITHYFPAAEDLVIAAFVRAASEEREELIPHDGDPTDRMARFVWSADSDRTLHLGRLWLNARHVSRFTPRLAEALEEQEALDRDRLVELIRAGIAAGEFGDVDADEACVRIWMAVDGKGAYANARVPFTSAAYEHFVADCADWALGLRPGTMRAAVAAAVRA